ncbi:MAG: phosphatidylglycerol lysyltransferase domain-containing protein [Oscillospiraceae bacterium]|nr:phosphatidylglycerol lysyltransferase domain-containing protein [Oscillospiraceae bacterium]
MLEFRKIELCDKLKVEEYLFGSNFRGCEYTFGNIFLWSNYYNTEICITDEFCFEKINEDNNIHFVYPYGNGQVKTAVNSIIGYSEHNNIRPVICANKEITGKILDLYPNAKANLYRDFCDYIYLADDLENLKGKKYHGKRNHLNRFYENNWSFERLNSDNISECLEMNKLWSKENISENSEDSNNKLAELDVVQRSLELYDELGYDGGVLRVDGTVQAFTFGERSSDDTFVVHVEKALRKYQGAYTAINREFVKSLEGRYKYINREEDTGAENLRKSKLSYHPVFLEEKYLISFE